jgi:hypothetical protein
VVMMLPEIPDASSPDLKNALVRRREASINGRCACGAAFKSLGPATADGVLQVEMNHEDGCSASDAGIAALLEREPPW